MQTPNREILGGELFTVNLNDESFVFFVGTPVICHGLEDTSVSHLNGKVGDFRELSADEGLYKVYFEDKTLEPALLRHENIRVCFICRDQMLSQAATKETRSLKG